MKNIQICLGVCLIMLRSVMLYSTPEQEVDSLVVMAERSADKNSKAWLYARIAFEYHRSDPQLGLQYAVKALEQGTEIDTILFNIYNSYASNYTILNNYGKAIAYFKKALTHIQKTGDLRRIAMIEGNLGMVYMEIDDREYAQKHLFKALEIDSTLGYQVGVHIHKYNIAILYASQDRYDESVALLKEVLEYSTAKQDTSMMGVVYSKLGFNYMGMGLYNQAIESIVGNALPLMRKTKNDAYSMGIIYRNVGESYLQKYKALRESRASEKRYLAGLLEQAERYLDTSMIYSNQIGHNISLAYINLSLGEIYELKGKPEKALQFIREYVGLTNNLFSREQQIEMARQETRQELELMQLSQEAALQKAEKEQLQKRGMALFLLMSLLGSLALIHVYKKAVQARNREQIEKQKSEDLLLNILPGQVAEELKSTGKAAAKRYDDVTVLFTDFVSFSSKSEVLSPEEIVRELDQCFRAFDQIIEKHGLEKIKTIGDAYLAVAGLPIPVEDHGVRCCRASIEIRDYIQKRRARGGLFDIRIGLHSGPVIAGIVGLKKYAYDIWGDTVNVAARLEQYSEPGRINISTALKDRLPESYRILSRGSIQVKNGKEIEMHFLEEVVYDESLELG